MESMSDVTPYSIADTMGPVAMYGVMDIELSEAEGHPMSARKDKPGLVSVIERKGLRRATEEEVGSIMSKLVEADPMFLIDLLCDEMDPKMEPVLDKWVKKARSERVANGDEDEIPRGKSNGSMSF